MNTRPPKLNERRELDATVITEINKAYYSRLVAAPERARIRALNGFTVASAIVAALAAAGLAKGLGSASVSVKAIGYGALTLWLLAGIFYLAAVAGWRFRKRPARSADNANDAAWNRIEEAETEMTSIRKPMMAAQVLSLIAVVVTLVLIGLTLLQEGSSEESVVTLTRVGAVEVAEACGHSSDRTPLRLHAEIGPASLGPAFTQLHFTAGTCGGEPADVEIRTRAIRFSRSK